MRVVEHADVNSFLAAAGRFLLAAEGENSLMLGIAQTLRDRPDDYPGGAWMATIEIGETTAGAALRTPPHRLILTRMPSTAVSLLAQQLQDIPGVVGPTEEAEAFARDWSARKGVPHRRVMDQRFFQLRRVEPIPLVGGRACRAGAEDAEELLAWRHAYETELKMDGPLEDACRRFRLEIDRGNVWIWIDDRRTSMAACVGPTPRGIRIGGVYTPPELRGRGYATCLVAEVSRIKLSEGKEFCSLFTDLSNPTSNSIYRKIGYRPVCDFSEYRFGP